MLFLSETFTLFTHSDRVLRPGSQVDDPTRLMLGMPTLPVRCRRGSPRPW